MVDRLAEYRSGKSAIPDQNALWPLYGAGFENMGVDGKPIEVPTRSFSDDELLVRHDACGLCFSDLKVLNQGQNHVRVLKDMKTNPVTLGHEVSMTVMGVGKNLAHRYRIGDRLIIEADVYIEKANLAYGYFFQGGLSQYNVIDAGILNSDYGDMMIPIQPEMGYAESALIEPWACVVAAYRLEYRNQIKAGGSMWVIGAGKDLPYTISKGFDVASHPAKLYLTHAPAHFDAWLRKAAKTLDIEVFDVPSVDDLPVDLVDDIVLLGATAERIEKVSPRLAHFGVMAILEQQPLDRPPSIDVGRIHYHRWLYAGATSTDVAAAYGNIPLNPNLKQGSTVLYAGAGGPIGRMHVQRAIEFTSPPKVIVCTDVSDMRLDDLRQTYGAEARARGIELVCLNPTNKETYAAEMTRFAYGFDYVVVLAPVVPVIAESYTRLAPNGIMNVFAGVVRGTMVDLDLSTAYLKGQRVIGHSGSGMEDMLLTLDKTEASELSTNKSVAAIGSLSAARNGLMALKNTTYPGKVVIYPNIKEFPLTAVSDLQTSLPSVYAKLEGGKVWTNEAELEFLRLMLP